MGHPASHLGPTWIILAHLEAILEPSSVVLEPSRAVLELLRGIWGPAVAMGGPGLTSGQGAWTPVICIRGAGVVRQRRPRIAAPDERERLACVALTAKASFMQGGLLT